MTLSTNPPSAHDYIRLRKSVGWITKNSIEQIESGFKNSLAACSVFENQLVVGMGRVVGDGHLYFYLQDLIVDPAHQKQRVGELILKYLMGQISMRAHTGAFVGLMAAHNVEMFYAKYGFKTRGTSRPGMELRWSEAHKNLYTPNI